MKIALAISTIAGLAIAGTCILLGRYDAASAAFGFAILAELYQQDRGA